MTPAGMRERWRAGRERRAAVRRERAAAELLGALRDWAADEPRRVAAVEGLVAAGLLPAAATGPLRRWFPVTDDLAVTGGRHAPMVAPDLVGLGRALERGRVEGGPGDLAALCRLTET